MLNITFLPQNVEVLVEEGMTVLKAAAVAGVSIDGNCAGKGTCGKCKVRIMAGDLSYCTDPNRKLSEAGKTAGYRLACSPFFSDGMGGGILGAKKTAARKKKVDPVPGGVQEKKAGAKK